MFMKLSRTLALLAISGLLTTSAFSQEARPGGPRGGRSVEAQMTELSASLKLTEEQKPKVKAVLEEAAKKRAEFRNNTEASQEDRRAKMRSINEETTAKMKEVLTAEQFKQYQEFAATRRNRGPGQGGPGAPANPPGTNAPAGGAAQN